MLARRSKRKGKRQRFYARNAHKTTFYRAFGRLMHSFPADPPASSRLYDNNPSDADELCRRSLRHAGTAVRLYDDAGADGHRRYHAVGAVAGCDRLEPSAKDGWAAATRSAPAFAVSQFVFQGKTEAYEISRHPEGGRKDVFRWSGPDGKAGRRTRTLSSRRRTQSGPAVADIAARMDPDGARELEAAGMIDSKFGPVTLLRPGRRRRRCPRLPRLHEAHRRSQFPASPAGPARATAFRPAAPRSAAC